MKYTLIFAAVLCMVVVAFAAEEKGKRLTPAFCNLQDPSLDRTLNWGIWAGLRFD